MPAPTSPKNFTAPEFAVAISPWTPAVVASTVPLKLMSPVGSVKVVLAARVRLPQFCVLPSVLIVPPTVAAPVTVRLLNGVAAPTPPSRDKWPVPPVLKVRACPPLAVSLIAPLKVRAPAPVKLTSLPIVTALLKVVVLPAAAKVRVPPLFRVIAPPKVVVPLRVTLLPKVIAVLKVPLRLPLAETVAPPPAVKPPEELKLLSVTAPEVVRSTAPAVVPVRVIASVSFR